MKHNKIVPQLIISLILVCASLIILFNYYPKLHPLSQQDFRISEEQLPAMVSGHIPDKLDINQYDSKYAFIIKKDYFIYQHPGLDSSTYLENPAAYWQVELQHKFEESDRVVIGPDENPEEFSSVNKMGEFKFSAKGKLLFLDLQNVVVDQLDSNDTSGNLDIEFTTSTMPDAKNTAQIFLFSVLKDTSRLSLINQSVAQDSAGEVFTFSYRESINKIAVTHTLKIINQATVYYNYEIDTPEKDSAVPWWKEKASTIFEVFFVVLFFILIITITIYLIKFVKNEAISFTLGFRLLIFILPVSLITHLFESWQSTWLIIILTGLGEMLFIALGAVFLYAVTDSLARIEWSDKLAVMDRLVQGYIFHKKNAAAVFRGLALGIVAAGSYTITCYFLQQIFNTSFQINESLKYSTALYLPAIGIALKVLNPAFFSEYFFRFFGMSVVKRWIKSPALLIFSGAILGMFLPDDINPVNIFSRVFTLLIPSLLFTYLLYRFEILTTIIGFLTYSLVKKSVVFFHTNSEYFSNISIGLFIIFSIVFLSALIVYLFKRNEVEDDTKFVPEYIKKQQEKQRLMRELEIARNVQMRFLPSHTPQIENYQIAASCQPAWEVGGDYFDYFNLPDGKLGIAIGDVSNKGVSAAFYMTLVKGFLKALCEDYTNPADILTQTNQLFMDNVERGHFISMIFGILDPQKNSFRFARAGHNPLLLMLAEDSTSQWKIPPGVGIGLTGKTVFREQIREETIFLKKKDIIILYTDGFSESMNPQSEEFGETRMQNVFSKNKDKTAGELILELEHSIAEWENSRAAIDDKTIVVIKHI